MLCSECAIPKVNFKQDALTRFQQTESHQQTLRLLFDVNLFAHLDGNSQSAPDKELGEQ